MSERIIDGISPEARQVLDLLPDAVIYAEWQSRRARRAGRRALKCGHEKFNPACTTCKKSARDRGMAFRRVLDAHEWSEDMVATRYKLLLDKYNQERHGDLPGYLVTKLKVGRGEAEVIIRHFEEN